MLYHNKRHWLNDLYEKILLVDVIQRNRVKNELALRLTIKRLAESVKHPTSFSRIANLIKTTGISTSAASVIEYAKFAKEACVLFSLENYASKFVEKETVKKHYFVDNGLLSIFLTNGETALLENVCAILRHRKYGEKLYYYHKNIEVDFYVPEEGYAVQVAYSIMGPNAMETYDREIGALKKLRAFQPINKMGIVTFDEESTIEIGDGLTIEVIPAWKWLLK